MTTSKTPEQLLQAIKESVATVLDMETSEISETSHLVNDLGAESIDFLDISSELEKLIDIEVDFTEAAGDDPSSLTIAKVMSHIQQKLG